MRSVLFVAIERQNDLFRKVCGCEAQSVRAELASHARRVTPPRQEFCMFWSSARALRFMKASIAVILALTTSLFGQSPPQKHPFTFEDMMKLKRVGAPVPSPDGKWVLFDAEDVDLEANTRISHLWIVPANGGESRRLNPTPNHEERPRFSPDGKRLIWTSKATDPTQIWMCDFETESGRAGRYSPGNVTKSRPVPTAGSGRRMGRTSCSSQRFIPIAKMTPAIRSGMKS